jgi:cell division protein ZapA
LRRPRRWRLSRTVEIEIYGQRYLLKGEADPEYIQRLAGYVDGQMRELSRLMKTATPSKLAVLAAINIAHQLFEAEKLRQQDEADVDQRAVYLMESIEEQLKVTPARLARPVRSN